MLDLLPITTTPHFVGEPCARVRVTSTISGLQAIARQLGGWSAIRRVGWVKPHEVRAAQGRYRHALVVVHGWRRGQYYLALHWTTAAKRLGGCLLLVIVQAPPAGHSDRLAAKRDAAPVNEHSTRS